MLRARFAVPVVAFALSAIAAVAPSVSSAAGDSVAVAIHDGGDMANWGYGPSNATISVGQSVTFTNTGTSPHDATALDGSWNTPLLQTGQSAPVTFSTPGTFGYTCVLHPWMKGTITVAAAAPAPAPSSSDASTSNDSTITAPAPAPATVDVAPPAQSDGSDSGS